MTRTRSVRTALGLVVVVALLAGCGTTVHGLQQAGGQRDAGGLGTAEGAAAPVAGASGVAGGPAPRAVGGPLPGSAATGPAAVGTSGPVPVGPAVPSAGTRTPYKVGLLYSTNAQAALSALGAKGSIGDVKAEGDAVIRYVNAHGGVGGRRLVAAWYNGDATQSSTAIADEACAAWTQDDHVDAAAPGGSIVDMNAVRSCLAKHAVPAVSVEYHVQTRLQDFRSSPFWAEPLGMSMESYARTYADGLASQGFFAPTSKVGIVYDDGADWTSVEQTVLQPELARHGAHVVATGQYQVRGFPDVGGSEPTINAMVLKFKAAGVDRVVFFEPWDGYAFFMQSAANQGYRPRYGLSSQAAFAATYATGLVPASQLVGAAFVGWSPVLDRADIGSSWPREQQCLAILRNAGIHPDGPLATAIAFSTCDGLLDIAALGSAVGGQLTPATFGQALDRVTWGSALLPTVRLSAARPYGVVSVRAGAWNASCSCFAFSGPGRPAAP